MQKRKKSKNMLRHVKNRFQVRWGINLTENLHRELILLIHHTGKLIQKQSNRVFVYQIDYENKTMTLIYDRVRKMLISVLPPNAVFEEDYNK